MTSDPNPPPEELAMVAVTTTALWLFCLTVGIAGLILHYAHPVAPAPQLPPVQAQLINVQLTAASRDQPPPQQPSSVVPTPPDAVNISNVPPAPALIPVAAPSPAIPFARPVAGPTTLVSARQAAPRSNEPPVQRLVFGSGEGRQPKPDYPREAALAHEEGTVLVRFTVDQDGSVASVSDAKPSPFALLDQAAMRKIHDEWRFPSGPQRVYEISITFQLKE